MANDSEAGRRLVCHCFNKTSNEIAADILRLGIKSMEDAARRLTASNGCTLCRPEIEKLLRRTGRKLGRPPTTD